MSPLLCYKPVPCYIYQSLPGLGSRFCPYMVRTKVSWLRLPGLSGVLSPNFLHRHVPRWHLSLCAKLPLHQLLFPGITSGSVPAQIIPKPASWGSWPKIQWGFSRCKLEDVQNKGVYTKGKRRWSWSVLRTKLALGQRPLKILLKSVGLLCSVQPGAATCLLTRTCHQCTKSLDFI